VTDRPLSRAGSLPHWICAACQAGWCFADLREAMAARSLLSLESYYRLLSPITQTLDIWETEQLQAVDGKSPIYDWVKVSALRPVMQGLKDDEQARFIYHYLMRVHAHYPPESDGHTLFPFKRIFIATTV
jgi:trans-aconitate 2-methyltransferase